MLPMRIPELVLPEPRGYFANATSRDKTIHLVLKWWRREESEYSGVLKTRNLLIFRDAKNAKNGKIALNWNVSGTRDFSFVKQNSGYRFSFALSSRPSGSYRVVVRIEMPSTATSAGSPLLYGH